MRLVIVGLAALALVACSGRPTATSSGVTTGARVTKLNVIRPDAISAMWNLGIEGGLADGSLVLIVAAVPQPALAQISGGTGTAVSGHPGTYTFAETLTPAGVTASTSPRSDGHTDFTTVAAFDWKLPMNPVDSWLPLHEGVLAGSLDQEGVPTSDVPALSGTLRGCFTTAEAQAVLISQLNVTVAELATMSGAQPDADCGSGAIDGYAFEAQWEASAVIQLVDAG